MKKKPLIIELIAIFVCVFPAIVFGRVLTQIQVHNLSVDLQSWIQITLLALLCYAIGYGVWKVRMWGYFGILLLSAMTIGYELWRWLISESSSSQLSHAIYFDVTSAALAFFLITQKKIRHPYFDPRIRWWETAARYVGNIPGVFQFKGIKIESPVLDISSTGCFVNFETDLDLGAAVDVEINFNSLHFSAPAVLVRKSVNPAGLGLKFTSISPSSKKAMKKILAQLTQKR